MKKLSIIIPVYNVEKYILPCLESVFRQGLDDKCYEVIIVNDGTQDKSMEVINKIICSHDNIKIINQKNQGLSVARNNGIEASTGEYLMFIDSDDLLIENSIHTLLESTLDKPDIIVAELLKMNDEDIQNYQKTPHPQREINVEKKTGQSLLMDYLHPRQCYVVRSIYKKEFLENNHIRFIPGIYFEDIPFTHRCYLMARYCVKTDIPIYIYRIGHASITGNKLSTKKALDFCTVISILWDYSKEKWPPEIKLRLKDNSFDIFSLLFYSMIEEIKDTSEIKYIINYMKEIVPDLSYSNGKKQKLVTFLYKTMPLTYIRAKKYYQRFAYKYIY